MSAPVGLPPVTAQPLPPVLLAAAGAAVPSAAPVATLDGSSQALAALAALANSASFAGTVAAGDSADSLVLVTSFGTFALDSATPLPIGAQLTLQTVASTPGGVAILTIDNTPTVTPAPAQPGIGLPSPAGPDEAPPTIVDLGTLVTATVIAAVASDVANEVPAPPIVPPGPVPPSEPGQNPVSAAEAISPSGPSRDTITLPGPDVRLIAEIARSDSAPDANLPNNTTAARNVAGVMSEGPIPSGRVGVQEALSGSIGVAPPADTATKGQRDGVTVLDTPQSTPPSASQITALPPGMRALPVGASLILRILAFQTVAAPGGGSERASPEPSVPAPPGPALSGIVRIADPAGATIETAIGALRLAPVPALPVGAQIALRLLPGEPATAMLTVIAPTPADAGAGELTVHAGTSPAAPIPTSPSDPPEAPREVPSAPRSAVIAEPNADQSAPGPAFVTRIFIAPTATGAAAAPRAVIGTVLEDAAATPAAASVVETPLGVLAVAPRLALPPGTLLLLAAQDSPLIPDTFLTGRPTGFERGWPALQSTIGAINQTGPTLATRLIADLSVHGGETLAATLLFLVATLRGSGPSTWPGQAIERALALAGRDDLKQRLGEDVGELRRIAADPATGHWQVFLLPVHDGTAFRPVRLYLARRDKRGAKGRRDEDNSRFVLEFELSRIGALQLDGFIRRRRFDLALRSRSPLDADLRADIARIFHARIGAAGLTGEIDFATVAQFDIAPLDARQTRVGLAV